jgi:hypothetical protein
VNGFWSMTLYNEHHFFHPNALKRYSLGTKNKGLQRNSDGSLTLYAGHAAPRGAKGGQLAARAQRSVLGLHPRLLGQAKHRRWDLAAAAH